MNTDQLFKHLIESTVCKTSIEPRCPDTIKRETVLVSRTVELVSPPLGPISTFRGGGRGAGRRAPLAGRALSSEKCVSFLVFLVGTKKNHALVSVSGSNNRSTLAVRTTRRTRDRLSVAGDAHA
ncbi:hypothetical protein EVAR_53597_1 [Eumeta japonica]|uniref:Uncharacterized protein n=1 Tax=Eumeta variegata TaxID=151549 RepID=A0A4C1WY90_EUMVA|nr:hypothetical protein EVAR_53597_1 [Eumeta japonica]